MRQALDRLGALGIIAAIALAVIFSAIADSLQIEDAGARLIFLFVGGIVSAIAIVWMIRKE